MKRLAVALVLMALVLGAVPALAVPALPAASEAYTDVGILAPAGTSRARLALYDYPGVTAYQVDSDYSMLDIGSHMWKAITNALLLLTAVVVKLGIQAMTWAFSLSLVTTLVAQLDKVLSALASSLWDARLVQVTITCAGLWAAWTGLVLRRTAQAVGIMVTVVVLVALAAWSFAGGLTWGLVFMNEASTEVSGALLSSLSRVVDPQANRPAEATEAITAAGEAIWKVFVAQPWAIAEFGSLSSADNHVDNSLPGDRLLFKTSVERNEYYENARPDVKKRDFSWWKAEGTVPRLVVAFLALLVGVAFGVMLLAMSGAVLAFQMLAILLLTAAPIVFLLGLIMPSHGAYLVSKWAARIVGALATKVVLASLLSLVLVFCSILFTVAEPYGWAAGSLLQLVLVAAVLMNWKALFGFFSTLPSSPQRAIQRLAELQEPALVRSGRTALAGAAGGYIADRWTAVKEHGARKEATATLNQRLTLDRIMAEKSGSPTPLMQQVSERIQKGAQEVWTDTEIRTEMTKNRDLRYLGADPRAVASGLKDDKAYYARVERVRDKMRETDERLEAGSVTFRTRVQQQAKDRFTGSRSKP